MSIRLHLDQPPFIVCPTCEGNGTHGPGFVYTQEDRDEMGEEFFDHMDDLCAGVYDVVCEHCKGQRVVRDECDCDDCEETRRDMAEMYAIERAERAFGC